MIWFNLRRRMAIETLYWQFCVETRGLPYGYRPGDPDDAIARDEARGIVSRYRNIAEAKRTARSLS